MHCPLSADVVAQIDAIMMASLTREEVAQWAAAALDEHAGDMQYHVWRCLTDLSDVARMGRDGTYVHHGSDILEWRALLTADFSNAPPASTTSPGLGDSPV